MYAHEPLVEITNYETIFISSVFGGFLTSPGVSNVTVRLTHAVAMDCGVLPSSPQPAITWRMNGVTITETLFPDLKYRFLDDGQYLVIYNLESADVNAGMVPVNYQCEVTNVNASLTEVSPTMYNLIEVGRLLILIFIPENTPY